MHDHYYESGLKHHISYDAEGFISDIAYPTWAIDAISIKASGFTKPHWIQNEQAFHPENILHIPYSLRYSPPNL